MPDAKKMQLINADAIQATKDFNSMLTTVESEVKMCGSDETLRSMVLAAGLWNLEERFTDLMVDMVRRLENHPRGYKTDKQYSNDEIRPLLLEARMEGLNWTGNEMNILGGNLYTTRAGLERLCFDHEAVDALVIRQGVPTYTSISGGEVNQNTMLVPLMATFRFNRNWQDQDANDDWVDIEFRCVEKDELDERIVVKLNNNQGTDAAIGKAKRKLFSQIYAFVQGKHLAVVDEDGMPEAPIDVDFTVESKGVDSE